MAILRTFPIILTLQALQDQLNQSEAGVAVDGQTIKVTLISVTADQAETPQSPTVPVNVNLGTFQPAGADPGGTIQLVGDVPPATDPDNRQAFFAALQNSTLTTICFSNLYIQGAPQEVVVCRTLADSAPPASDTAATSGSASASEASAVVAPQAPAEDKILNGDGTWPFEAEIVGDDIVVEDVVITCFGGNGDGTNNDPRDLGDTSSGVNTNDVPVDAVSIAMDGRLLKGLNADEHAALDGAPIPPLRKNGNIAWHTLVEVTIGEKIYTPADGIIDLGPGKQASRPGNPHGLDLTVTAVGGFDPAMPLKQRATDAGFSQRGSFRIIGGARLIG